MNSFGSKIRDEIQIGDLRVFLVEGDITREQTDAIVNRADSGFNLSGSVAHSILQAAGQSVREELQQSRILL